MKTSLTSIKIFTSPKFIGVKKNIAYRLKSSKKLLLKSLVPLVFTLFFFVQVAKADYTINNGVTIDPANTPLLLNATGTISIYGTLEVNSDVIFTSTTPLNIILYGANGQIFWNTNKTLKLPAGSTITYINNPQGLLPSSGAASQILEIGDVKYAAGNDNSNNVVYSFLEINIIGGTAKINPSPSVGPFCSGSSINFLANQIVPSGDVINIKWLISTGSSTFSPNNTSNASSTTLSALMGGTYTVTCELYSDAGRGNFFLAATKSFTFTVTSPGTWLGANTNWNSTLNWCNGSIPSSTTNVIINSGLAFYPTISGTTGLVNNLTVATGASVIVTGTLKIAGSITSTNAITATVGTIEMNGTVAQTISGSNFVSNTIGNIVINNTRASASSTNPSVTIASQGGILSVSGAVSFGSLSNAWLNTNDNLTLLSTAINTARIADITNNDVNSGNGITGKVVIERFITAKRAWRLLSAPVTAASNVKISDSWQENGRVTDAAVINSANNPNTGYGTHITFGKPAAPGYDQGINGATSIKYLTATGWNGIPTATNGGATPNSGYFTDQQGYFLFVRGDRSIQLSQGTTSAATTTTLRMKGVINTGLINIPLGAKYTVGSSNFRIIGNPFASAINFHKIAINVANDRSSFADAFYVWDPNIGSNLVGGWVALSYNSGTRLYDRTVVSGGNSTVNNSGDIQSGAAFMINYNGAATTLQIKESNKAAGSNLSQFRPLGTISQIRTTLLEKLANKSLFVNDATLVTFNDAYNNAADEQDMNKMFNFSENLGVVSAGKSLAIERRLPIAAHDTIMYQLTQMKQKNYQLELVATGLNEPAGTAAFLEDAFLKSSTPISLKDTNRIDFTVNATIESAKTDRFKLVFRPSVNFLSVLAYESGESAMVEWKLADELNINRFEIERSFDGLTFKTIGTVLSRGESKETVLYNWIDENLAAGNYYYRIKSISNNNVILFSKNMYLKILNRKAGMYVYPNPVKGNIVAVQMNGVEAGEYAVRLTNETGILIQQQTVNHNGVNGTILINTKQTLVSGFYQLQFINSNKKITTLKVLAVN